MKEKPHSRKRGAAELAGNAMEREALAAFAKRIGKFKRFEDKAKFIAKQIGIDLPVQEADLFISSAADLKNFANRVNGGESFQGKLVRLNSNINIGGTNWTPIGYDKPFRGTFDGGNHTISGLKFSKDVATSGGLFGRIEGGAVKNLAIQGADVIGNSQIGGIAGFVSGGIVENCHAHSVGVTGCSYVGGLVGNLTSSSKIERCSFFGMVAGVNIVGGIAGYVKIDSSVENSCVEGSLVFGLDKYFNNKIKDPTQYIGGIAGYVVTRSSLRNCYALSTIYGNKYIGGIAGNIDVDSNCCVAIENCYSAGAAVSNTISGGIVGSIQGSEVSNCAALNQSTLVKDSAAGRVAAISDGGKLKGNAAFADIIIKINGTDKKPLDKGGSGIDGEDISASAIAADGTIGGRFTAEDGWTAKNGYLPGLFGKTVNMPSHISDSLPKKTNRRK